MIPEVAWGPSDGDLCVAKLEDRNCDPNDTACSVIEKEIDLSPLMVLGLRSGCGSSDTDSSLDWVSLVISDGSLLAPRMEKWKCGPRYLTFSFLKGRVTCLLLLGLVNVWRIWYATGLEFHSCTTVGNVSGWFCYRLSCHQEICGWSDQETVGWCQNRHQVGAPGAKAGHPMEAPGGSLWSPTWLLLSPKSVLCISLYLGATGTCPMPAARCHYRPLLTRAS